MSSRAVLFAYFVLTTMFAASANAQSLPQEGRFNLRCTFSIRTVSGPKMPEKITGDYAVDLDSQHWCVPKEGCTERLALRRADESFIELVVRDSFSEHERVMINLKTGKAAGSSDDAPNGLINGFRTYLSEGQCSSMPYAETPSP